MIEKHEKQNDRAWKITNVRIVSENGVIQDGELYVHHDTIVAVKDSSLSRNEKKKRFRK